MSIKINGVAQDGMKEACERLGISRATVLRYLKEGYFSKPKRHRQGRGKTVRYFDAAWYQINEKKLRADQKRS
jgi:predicted site-specific integrase-resolvase